MRFFELFCIKFLFLCFTSLAYADSLSGDELRKVLLGKTINFSMLGGKIPIRYNEGGIMSGKVVGMISLIPSGVPAKDQGRWWITKNSLCQQWNNWLENKSYCYQFKQNGDSVSWYRSDGKSGSAQIVSK